MRIFVAMKCVILCQTFQKSIAHDSHILRQTARHHADEICGHQLYLWRCQPWLLYGRTFFVDSCYRYRFVCSRRMVRAPRQRCKEFARLGSVPVHGHFAVDWTWLLYRRPATLSRLTCTQRMGGTTWIFHFSDCFGFKLAIALAACTLGLHTGFRHGHQRAVLGGLSSF